MTKTTLTNLQRHDICLKRRDNPAITQKDLVQWCEEEFSVKIDQATISRILKRSNEFLGTDTLKNPLQKRARNVKFPELEKAVLEWCLRAQEKIPLTGQLIVEKAQVFASLLGVSKDEITFSNGWLRQFKERHNFKQIRMHGESGSVDDQVVEEAITDLKQLTNSYEWKDIYNMDETGLFFRMEPDTTLATRQLAGKKKNKERLSVALCCNGDGSHKIKALVIGRSAKPRCFKNINLANLGVMYRYNKKAWMTAVLFQEWLRYFDGQMHGRKVLLLLDNAPSHIVTGVRLNNTTVKFLPPNTTSRLQPCDAGIIASFKAHYRRKFVRYLLEQFESGSDLSKLSVLEAILFIRESWQEDVTPTTIANCFRHINIREEWEEVAVVIETVEEEREVRSAIGQDIQLLRYRHPMETDHFLNPEGENIIDGDFTDEEIVKLVCSSRETEESTEDEDDSSELPPVSTKEAMQSLDMLTRFFLGQEGDYSREINSTIKIGRVLRRLKEKSLVQKRLDDYFSRGGDLKDV
jgi:hypothetical protein